MSKQPDSPQALFTRIYNDNAWGDAESRSGPGSTVHRTRLVRPALETLFRNLGIRTLLDLPCGDFNWMRHVDLRGIDYTGADIVDVVVQDNTLNWARPGVRFVRLDMTSDALPRADLILCRDGLVHLSFHDIARALHRMRESGSEYLLVTTFDRHPANSDIETGDWRPLNLRLPPFWLPPPLGEIWDGPRPDGAYRDKKLALFRIAGIPEPAALPLLS